jgi:hypothetical protein
MRYVRPVAAALAAVLLSALPASAKLLIEIDKSAQRMTVSEDGAQLFTWPVSTGTRAYETPSGTFTPFRMERDHFSREWDDAPMPNSIFFTKQGHAIHGTNHSSIGRPASHGCVRLSVAHSRALFDLVKQEGMSNVKVVLFGETPGANAPAVARHAPDYRGRRNADDDMVTGSLPPSRRLWHDDRYERRGYDRYGRRGTWVLRRDGSWLFYDREGYGPPPPPPPFAVRPWGWN